MDKEEIKLMIERLESERDKQKEKVEKLSKKVNEGRVKLSRETEKLQMLEERVNAQKFFLVKEELSGVGMDGENGLKELIAVYENYMNDKGE